MVIPALALDGCCGLCEQRTFFIYRDGLQLCLFCALKEECLGCGGKLVIWCHIEGCGDWKPANEAAKHISNKLFEYYYTAGDHDPFKDVIE